MGGPFAAGKHAFGFCDRCGFRYPLGDLRAEVVNLEQTGIKACPECWNPDQPQNQLGRKPMVDAQALRNPRPTGAIAGRDLEAAYRWDFSTGTALTDPTRIDAWWAHRGIITWDSVNKTLNLVSDGTSDSPGDPHLVNGWYGGSVDMVPLSIDTSIYKFVTTVFKVNRFPDFEPDDRYQYDFQGDLFWQRKINETVATNDRDAGVTDVYVTSGSGFATGKTIDITLDTLDFSASTVASFDRIGGTGLSNVYVPDGGGDDFDTGVRIDITLDDSEETFSPTLDSIGSIVIDLVRYDVFNLSEAFPGSGTVMSTGNAITQGGELTFSPTLNSIVKESDYTIFNLSEAFPGSGTVMSAGNAITQEFPTTAPVPYPFSLSRSQRVSHLPVLTNIQASDGFLTADRKMSPWFKLVWDMTDNPEWTGIVNTIRLDYFDARNSEGPVPDYDAGDIDIDYIAVEAFHNFNLEPDPIGPW